MMLCLWDLQIAWEKKTWGIILLELIGITDTGIISGSKTESSSIQAALGKNLGTPSLEKTDFHISTPAVYEAIWRDFVGQLLCSCFSIRFATVLGFMLCSFYIILELFLSDYCIRAYI